MGKLLVIIFLYTSASAAGQSNTPFSSCAEQPICRLLDFWVGEWEVKGKNGQVAGKSSIQISLDSCLIIENWTGTSGGTGKSFNFYNANNAYWQQTWVDNSGGSIEFIEGRFENSTLQFARSRPLSDGSIKRLSFSKIDENRVRQLGETSLDEGKTWSIEYDLIYYRKGK